MTICKNIVRANVVFPEYVVDPGAKDIVRALLTKCVYGLMHPACCSVLFR